MSSINYPYINFLSTVVSLPVIDNNTVLGNVSGSSALAAQISATQLTALINTFSSLSGAVPGSSGGITNFLRADGTFAAPPAQNYALVDTKVANSSSSLQFTSGISSTYSLYEFKLTNVVPSSNAVQLELQISQDGGTTYLSSNYTDAWLSTTYVSLTTSASNVSNTANVGINASITMATPSSTSNTKPFFGLTSYLTTGGAYGTAEIGGYFNGNTSAINAVRFQFTAGSISSGTIRMYGYS